ncbi:MAG: PDZ domain-containing protein, partial [Phycisphaerales bacterium]
MSNRRTLGRASSGSALTLAALTAAAASSAFVTLTATAGPMPDEWAGAFDFRRLGPANMSGRITDITVYEADPNIFWLAAASGGILKTVNGGTTFEHQFTREAVASIGDVEVSQTNPDIIWVGTGEENPRNSVSWGNGVYKSVDGGKTFEHMGLKDSFQIGSIRIHPTNPDVVYVGALGRLWGPSEERGLYRTTDGGATWDKIIDIDENTGIMDIELHPEDPNTILVASYERRRDMFDTNDPATKFGKNAGIWRSTDGGDSWDRMVEGLPTVPMGRMDIEYFRGNPDRVYAIIETELIGTEPENAPYMGIRGEDAGVGARLTEITEDGPAADAGLKSGDIVLKMNERPTLTYTGLTTEIRKYEAGDSVTVELIRDGEFETVDLSFAKRPSEGDGEVDIERARRSSPFGTRLGGQRAGVQDQQGPNGFENGGLFRSEDGGYTWSRINSINPRPMYFSEIAIDPQDDNFIHVAGISLHTSADGGKTFRSNAHVGENGAAHVDHHAIWVDPTDGRRVLLGNDGGLYITNDRMKTWDHNNHFDIGQFYHVTVDNRPNYRVYGGLQDNGSWGGPMMVRDAPGSRIEDWYRVGGGDGFICRTDPNDPDLVYYQSQNGGFGRINIRTGERGRIRVRPERGVRNRFNWRAPFILSEFNSRIYYAAGNRVFKSVQGGEDMLPISPNITATDRGAATALTESPRNREILYVGTDDGALWMTENGGQDWVDLFDGNEPSGGNMVASVQMAAADEAGSADDAMEAPRERRPRGERGARGNGERGDRGARARQPEAAAAAAGRGGGAGAGGRGAAMLEMLLAQDADKDGRIARSEMSGRMAGMFDRLDADGNDVLDRAELKALADRLGVSLPPVEAAGPALASEVAAAMRDLTARTVSTGAVANTMADAVVALADDISGEWTGTAAGDAVQTGSREITMVFALKGKDVTGSLTSPMGEIPIEGTWDAEKRTMLLDADTGEFSLTIKGTVDEKGQLKADVEVGGRVVATIEAKRTRSATPAADAVEEVTEVPAAQGRRGAERGQRGQGAQRG